MGGEKKVKTTSVHEFGAVSGETKPEASLVGSVGLYCKTRGGRPDDFQKLKICSTGACHRWHWALEGVKKAGFLLINAGPSSGRCGA